MFGRFLLVGGVGFLIDLGVTLGLQNVGMDTGFARIFGIALAMTFTWLANRSFTYRSETHRSMAEAVRYAATAATLAIFNWLLYVFALRWGYGPVFALILATACQAVVSFYAYRIVAFRRK